MSDGQLHMRVRAYQREQTWAPRMVANELAGTNQAADTQRATAARRAAEAAAATDPITRAKLQTEAAEAVALAETLDAQTAQLRDIDDARAHWLAHTAGTRAAYDRALLELAARHAGDEHAGPQVTAEEWLGAHEQVMRAEDTHRPVTDETDLTDTITQHDRDVHAVRQQPADHADIEDAAIAAGAKPEVGLVDLRELAATEPDPADEHSVRVPTADESAESIRRAQRALEEIADRDSADRAREQQEARDDELTRWPTDNRHAGRTAEQQHSDALAYDR